MMTIEHFGARVTSVWEGLRPATRDLVERALRATPASPQTNQPARSATVYDARSEWELSLLLAALDERATETQAHLLSDEQKDELGHMVAACVAVLQSGARSAEVFGQLLERALRARNYAGVDVLADALNMRVAPTELCELARHVNPAVRALAHEALMQMPTATLVTLLGDPVDADIARDALEHQADEYGSEEARWIVNALDHAEAVDDDM
jgi:hypothetical protein